MGQGLGRTGGTEGRDGEDRGARPTKRWIQEVDRGMPAPSLLPHLDLHDGWGTGLLQCPTRSAAIS